MASKPISGKIILMPLLLPHTNGTCSKRCLFPVFHARFTAKPGSHCWFFIRQSECIRNMDLKKVSISVKHDSLVFRGKECLTIHYSLFTVIPSEAKEHYSLLTPSHILAINASLIWLSTTFPPPNNIPITSKRVSPL
jgi:hypothetical protein